MTDEKDGEVELYKCRVHKQQKRRDMIIDAHVIIGQKTRDSSDRNATTYAKSSDDRYTVYPVKKRDRKRRQEEKLNKTELKIYKTHNGPSVFKCRTLFFFNSHTRCRSYLL